MAQIRIHAKPQLSAGTIFFGKKRLIQKTISVESSAWFMALSLVLGANLSESSTMKRSAVLVLLLVLATAGAFWLTSVVTLTLYPTKDSYSWESVPLSNNGNSDNFGIMSANVNPLNMRGWIEFNISGVPSNAWIITAQFRLRMWSKSPNDPSMGFGDSTGRIYGVYRLAQPWGEENVTWANQPNYTEDHYASAAVPSGQTNWAGPPLYMSWDLTPTVRDWQSGIPNYGLVVRDTHESSPILYATQFFTHNKVPDQSYYPRLTVTYIMPQSLVVLGGVLLVEALAITVAWWRHHPRPTNPNEK